MLSDKTKAVYYDYIIVQDIDGQLYCYHPGDHKNTSFNCLNKEEFTKFLDEKKLNKEFMRFKSNPNRSNQFSLFDPRILNTKKTNLIELLDKESSDFKDEIIGEWKISNATHIEDIYHNKQGSINFISNLLNRKEEYPINGTKGLKKILRILENEKKKDELGLQINDIKDIDLKFKTCIIKEMIEFIEKDINEKYGLNIEATYNITEDNNFNFRLTGSAAELDLLPVKLFGVNNRGQKNRSFNNYKDLSDAFNGLKQHIENPKTIQIPKIKEYLKKNNITVEILDDKENKFKVNGILSREQKTELQKYFDVQINKDKQTIIKVKNLDKLMSKILAENTHKQLPRR